MSTERRKFAITIWGEADYVDDDTLKTELNTFNEFAAKLFCKYREEMQQKFNEAAGRGLWVGSYLTNFEFSGVDKDVDEEPY